MICEELLDPRDRCHEGLRQVWKRRVTDDDQQCNAVPHDRIAFVRLVADAAIVGERDPATLANLRQPNFIRCVRRKMIGVPLDGQPSCFENLTESFAEVAVRKIDATHAARS